MDIDKLADKRTDYNSEDDQFHDERLNGHPEDEWPSRIEHAALDVLLGVAIGSSQVGNELGGVIGKQNFGSVTGQHYTDGLYELTSGDTTVDSTLPKVTDEYGTETVGDLVYRLNEFRDELQTELSETNELRDLNHAVGSVIEKLAFNTDTTDTPRDLFQSPESITDFVIDLFSDPAATKYVTPLLDNMDDVTREGSLLQMLDAPYMTTQLWPHQQDALRTWLEEGQAGYVDMATATGKTVLGLSTIAALYGQLHPVDRGEITTEIDSQTVQTASNESDASVLVVAGKDVLLHQWQDELDNHMNIPPERTQVDGSVMNFTWGAIEFRTAASLLNMETVSQYDLVILDEAHRYGRGGNTSGWRGVLDTLISGSGALLALSGSIDASGDSESTFRRELDRDLVNCKEFSVSDALETGVIADFDWCVEYTFPESEVGEEALVTHTKPVKDVYDPGASVFPTEDLGDPLPEDAPSRFETLTDIRAFAQSKSGSNHRSSSDHFDEIATAAFTRRPKRWNLSPDFQVLKALVQKHAANQKCMVMVGSYAQAQSLGEELRGDLKNEGDDFVVVADNDAPDQFESITNFKKRENGVLIGPGEVLGTGVDLPDVEIAINVGTGGVSRELVQRIGRVLRNPDGDKEAVFYHVVTIAGGDDAILPGVDGRRLLKRASELHSYGKQMKQEPAYTAMSPVVEARVRELEVAGSQSIHRSSQTIGEIAPNTRSKAFLQELQTSIFDVGNDSNDDAEEYTLATYNPGEESVHDADTVTITEVESTEKPVAELDGDLDGEESNTATKQTSFGETMDDIDNSNEDGEVEEEEEQEVVQSDSERKDSGEDGGYPETVELTIPPELYYLIQQRLTKEEHDSIDDLAEAVVGTHISQEMNGDQVDHVTVYRDVTPDIPTHLERVVKEDALDESGCGDVSEFILTAVRKQAGVQTEPVMISLGFNEGFYSIMKSTSGAKSDCESVNELVLQALEAAFATQS